MFCDTCGHQYSDICGTCETLDGVPVKYKKKTNAERIRNMTDEELAEFIAIQHTECCYCKIVTDCFEQNDGDCSKAWLEWLKQEVSDDS